MLTSFILIVHMHLDDLLGIPDPLSCLLAPTLVTKEIYFPNRALFLR